MTLDVSKLEKFIEVNFEQPVNISDVCVISEVSK